ncbi:MAG: isochorismatase family protein [Pyrinomonadaceae bacterium]
MHESILKKETTALVVIDIQEGFRNAIPDFAVIASRAAMAVRGFQMLGVPVIVTEQYPAGLGVTAEEIRLRLPDNFQALEKTAFSSCGADGFVAKLDELAVEQVVLCGLETHVCVSQTAHDLLDRGLQVHGLTDCVCSRFEHDKRAGLQKMKASGVLPTSMEMALFELIRDAKHEQFKQIQELIK